MQTTDKKNKKVGQLDGANFDERKDILLYVLKIWCKLPLLSVIVNIMLFFTICRFNRKILLLSDKRISGFYYRELQVVLLIRKRRSESKQLVFYLFAKVGVFMIF